MEEAYDVCPSNDIKVLLGELNVKIGTEEICRGLEDTAIAYMWTKNNNWHRLEDFAAAQSILVSSSGYPHTEIQKQTWISPDGKTSKQIHYISLLFIAFFLTCAIFSNCLFIFQLIAINYYFYKQHIKTFVLFKILKLLLHVSVTDWPSSGRYNMS